jgi:glycosyltransferase involved in cell wall biosynthesis
VLADIPNGGASGSLKGKACSFEFDLGKPFKKLAFAFKHNAALDCQLGADLRPLKGKPAAPAVGGSTLLFDVSDLVYYIGHHDNLTGIQRVQACVLLGLLKSHPKQAREYISYNNTIWDFCVIDRAYFEALLLDLALPVAERSVVFDKMQARLGILPNASPLSQLTRDPDTQLVVYLLGAAWVNRDYFHRILDLKRNFNASFCITVHDLIPIFARETCDQGTAIVFEEFLRKSFLFADHYFTVSSYTAYDLHRFAASLGVRNLPVSVIENGHSFDEFARKGRKARAGTSQEKRRFGRDGYVLFVSTIEGRKNHAYIFDVWQELARTRPNLPVLICVGRFGWRAETFIERMLITGNLNNKIRVLSDVSDAELDSLYANCLFTVYPSTYEGWGLPVGESLSKGKLCASSSRSSIPEVAGPFGIYFDVDSVDDGVKVIGRLIDDPAYRAEKEGKLASDYKARSWSQVADELVRYVSQLPHRQEASFPLLTLGQEYKVSQLPQRNISALGAAMISQVQSARRAPLTGHINRDDDLLAAQASRFGHGWCAPEDWGTWSRYPECTRLLYVKPKPDTRSVIIYEQVRVVSLLVGATLSISLNDTTFFEHTIEKQRFPLRTCIPVDCDPGEVVELEIRYRLDGPPGTEAALDAIDGRRLGLGFESTLVLEDTDILTRLNLLESLFTLGPARQLATAARETPKQEDTRAAEAASDEIKSFAAERRLDSPRLEIGESAVLGEAVVLQSGAPAEQLLNRGWYKIEAQGIWSNRVDATLNFRVAFPPQRVFMLALDMRCIASAAAPATLSMVINDKRLSQDVVRDSGFHTRRFLVDSSVAPYDDAFVLVIHIDRLIAPADIGEGGDTRQLGVFLKSVAAEEVLVLSPGKLLPVGTSSAFSRVLANGWHAIEPDGAWAMGSGGRIVAGLAGAPTLGRRNVRLVVTGRVYGTKKTGPATVDVLVEGQPVTSWTFEDDQERNQTAIVPLSTAGDLSLLDVVLLRHGAVSPAEVEGGTDTRQLAIHVKSILMMDLDLGQEKADGKSGESSKEPKETEAV